MEEIGSIMRALSTLSPSHLSHLTYSLVSSGHRHHRRLSAVLSSPPLFSTTLRHLHSLSLPQKTLLIARHLLSSLDRLLLRHTTLPPPPLSAAISERDLDALLLLLFFCETHQHNPEALQANYSDWQVNLSKLYSRKLLTLSYSPVGACAWTVLVPYIEMVCRSWRLVGAMGCGGGKEAGEVAASAATVMGLPAAEVRVGGRERDQCVICKEEMREGNDVCELPCQHLFHWMCIVPWLRKTNTCPCCRFRLPSDHVYAEIQRLWEVLVNMNGRDRSN